MGTGYLEDGSEVEVVDTTTRGYIIARQVYEADPEDGGSFLGEEFIADKVYDTPPVVKRHKVIAELEEKAAKLRTEISSLHTQLTTAKSQLQNIAKHPDLSRLEAYLEGRLTHLVVDHYGWQIIAVEEAKSDGSDRYCKDLRLLSLMGRRGGTPEWMLNRYSDGSGGHYTAFPCTSYEEAQQILQKQIDLQAEDATKNGGSSYHLEKIAQAVSKHHLVMPAGVSDLLKAVTRQEAEAALAEAKKRFDAAQAALESVAATT